MATMSSSSTAIPSHGLRSFRYQYFVKLWGKEVLLTIFKYNFLHGTGKTIYEILKDSNVNLGKKSPFNGTEIQKLSSNVPPETLDITALYKVCYVLWDKGVQDPGDTLKQLLKKIKDERNYVSHEDGPVSEQELITKLTDFGNTLEMVLSEADNLYSHMGANFHPLRIQIKDSLSQIPHKIREKYDTSKTDDIKSFQRELEDFKDELHDYILERSREELRDVYSDMCQILPFDWLSQYGLTDPSDIMVSLKMELDREFHPQIINDNRIILDQNEMLNFKYPSHKDPKVVILTGNAGSGKTTLLSSIVEDWYKGMNNIVNLSTFQTLLYMQFRSFDHDSFDDYLQDLLQKTVCDFNINNVKASILHSKCLILCDGYDEANDKSKKLFESFLRLSCKEMKIVVTTRPVKAKEITTSINKSKFLRINLNMLGVPRENMESHIRMVTSYLKTDQTEKNEMITNLIGVFKVMDYDVSQILKNPLWLNLYILLHNECPDKHEKIETVTMLYMQLCEHCRERLTEKLEIDEDQTSEFDKFYREQSLRFYLEKKYELSQEDTKIFQTKCQELGLNFDSVMSSYYNIKHTKKGLKVVNVYCYRHRSEQEYAAASVICDELLEYYNKNKSWFEKFKEEGRNVILNTLVSHGFEQTQEDQQDADADGDEYIAGVMTFITGILYNTNGMHLLYLIIDDILDLHWKMEGNQEHSENADVDILAAHCIEACNDSKIVSAAAQKLTKIFNGNITTLRYAEPQSLSCLPHLLSVIKPNRLSLEYFENPSELARLIPILDIASKCSIDIALNFLLPTLEDANEYIEKAKTCVEFRGRLTKEGIKAIPNCMEYLGIRVNFEAIKTLATRLPDLENTNQMELHLYDDGSEDIRGLSSLNKPFESFALLLTTDLDVEDTSSIQRIASVINAIWPPKRRPFCFHHLTLKTKSSSFTGPAVKLLGELLTVQNLTTFTIVGAKQDALDDKTNLRAFYKHKGIGTLQFFDHYNSY